MGKYRFNIESDRSIEITKAGGIIYNANETAEANRLKRLELKLELAINLAILPKGKANFDFPEEEIEEDRA